MRPALTAPIVALAALSACGDKSGEPAGPERRTAAGEVLGGEVTDAMIPLDTVQSTSPAAPRPTASGADAPRTGEERRETLPTPEISGGPEPLPADPAAEDSPGPPQP